jgi:hypothetical protein
VKFGSKQVAHLVPTSKRLEYVEYSYGLAHISAEFMVIAKSSLCNAKVI